MFSILSDFLFSILDYFPTFDLSSISDGLINVLGTCKFIVGTFTFGFLSFVITAWLFRSLIIFVMKVVFSGALKIIDILS